MARIWATCLETGTKTWESVPAFRRTDVLAALGADVQAGRITADQYREITGEMYEEATA